MAGVTCTFCHAENPEGEQLCQECFRKLPAAAPEPDGERSPEPVPEAVARRAPEPAAEVLANCPHCGEEVPDPRNQVCVECHGSLVRTEASLRLSFPGGEVIVHPGEEVAVGRDPANSPVSDVFAERDNVSRLHATTGVDADGAWVRDENSTNGSYVNDVPVPPGARVRLAEGDTLRLAADVTATVHLDSATAASP
jgi:hypothetical protein